MQRDTPLTLASPEIGASPASLRALGLPAGAIASSQPRRNFDAGPRPAGGPRQRGG